jgi:hypothetical protein
MATCSKIPYATERRARLALGAITRMRDRGATKRQECDAYPCAACKAWHLTSRRR